MLGLGFLGNRDVRMALQLNPPGAGANSDQPHHAKDTKQTEDPPLPAAPSC